ncbi:hypothetical protein FVER14953_21477 [Fusarium verticillioides]|nr:hypothetical protein FVER14953_21477 [Fusarium verticillioides]
MTGTSEFLSSDGKRPAHTGQLPVEDVPQTVQPVKRL